MSETSTKAKRPTDEQLAEWKRKHKELHQVEMDGFIVILRKPRLVDLERAMIADKKGKRGLDFNRSLVGNCILYEDTEFRQDDDRELYLLSAAGDLAAMREGEIKKL